MIIKPRIRGIICTTAHPAGCAAHVGQQIDHVKSAGPIDAGVGNALILGCSGGYGLASRIVAAYGCGAKTLGVSFERPPADKRTATAGWYNNIAFEEASNTAGLTAQTLDGDAFSDQMKADVIRTLKADTGKIDLLVYSLASPVRADPKTGVVHRSAIKPLKPLSIKTINVDRGEVSQVDLEPASAEEVAATVAVMGGEDWQMWIDELKKADLLAPGFRTIAYTYLGSELTWPIYWGGTLGKAKEDLDRAAREIGDQLSDLAGSARVVSLKAVVSQASSAIPVVPLYISLLFSVMKKAGLHEDIISHIYRLFATQLAQGAQLRLDDADRIRMDDVELSDAIQSEVKRRWPLVNTENIAELGDLAGYHEDFLKIFGFGLKGVDYEAEQDPTLGRAIAD
ncbi:MAG: trans-2-enoyl-CoA reductase family protein [Proteobacteria bacterium]|nr:trans-2-enoyl-CoA reductase family protein [Pseudomonadota bacterium]